MARILVLILAALALAGCSIFQKPKPIVVTETVEVAVPYYVDREAPEWLAEAYQPERLPVFISPDDEDAVVGLDEEGLGDLRAILRTQRERDKAWIEWASDPPDKPNN